MDTGWKRLGRWAVVLLGALLGVGLGLAIFVDYPASMAELVGVLLAIALALLFARFARNLARSAFAPYDVAEVLVEGPISRSGMGGIPSRPTAVPAGAIVDQIERASDDANVDALVVRLNTPGGEVVPSEDIRMAVEDFDGPTVAYATDVCASGGYWIASGCDHVVAREGSLVGSIGVIMSSVNLSDLAERLGVSYERLAAGKFKDAGTPLKEFTEEDRDYLQGLTDDYYEQFLERVASGRDLDVETVQETEARVFLGPDAMERGLVDELGDEETVDAYLEDELDRPVDVATMEPALPLIRRMQDGIRATAYAAGAGAMSVLTDDGPRVR